MNNEQTLLKMPSSFVKHADTVVMRHTSWTGSLVKKVPVHMGRVQLQAAIVIVGTRCSSLPKPDSKLEEDSRSTRCSTRVAFRFTTITKYLHKR